MRNRKKPVNWREIFVMVDGLMETNEDVRILWREMRPLYKQYNGLPHPAELKREFYAHYDRVKGREIGSSFNRELREVAVDLNLHRFEEEKWLDSFAN